MGTCIPPTTARSSRRLVRLAAAAVTGLTARSAAAAPPVAPAPIEAVPRTPTIHSSYQTWVGFTAQGPIRDPLLMFVDLAGGFHGDMHPVAFVVRPALGLRLPHGFSVFAGYSYVSFWDAEHRRGEEHVAFQQVAYQAPFSVVELFGRARGEQRFRAGSDVGYRLRALVQLNVPFWRRAPLQVVLWNEAFLGLNQPGDWQPALMDQNLFFAGFGWQPDSHFRAEVGYQGALVPRPGDIEIVHCLSIGTSASW
jgi:hypothetical protein